MVNAHSSGESGRRPPIVLVVGDDHDCADSTADVLISYRVPARVAYDAASALTLASSCHPAAAVIDVAGMGESGIDAGAELRRSQGRSLRLVAFVTQLARLRERLEAAGFDELVLKGCHPSELVRAASPSTHELMMRSVAASVRQVTVQLDLAHSMIQHADLSGDRAFAQRVEALLALRLRSLRDLLARLPIRNEERDRLEREVVAVRDLLARRRKD